MADVVANVIVALVVLWSTVVALRKFMPKRMYAVQQAVSQQADRKGWLRLSRWLQPKTSSSSCGGCNSCADSSTGTCTTDTLVTPQKDDVKPVQWR